MVKLKNSFDKLNSTSFNLIKIIKKVYLIKIIIFVCINKIVVEYNPNDYLTTKLNFAQYIFHKVKIKMNLVTYCKKGVFKQL